MLGRRKYLLYRSSGPSSRSYGNFGTRPETRGAAEGIRLPDKCHILRASLVNGLSGSGCPPSTSKIIEQFSTQAKHWTLRNKKTRYRDRPRATASKAETPGWGVPNTATYASGGAWNCNIGPALLGWGNRKLPERLESGSEDFIPIH